MVRKWPSEYWERIEKNENEIRGRGRKTAWFWIVPTWNQIFNHRDLPMSDKHGYMGGSLRSITAGVSDWV